MSDRVQVVCSTVEAVRAAIFLELVGLPARQRSRMAVLITGRLRDARLLRSSAEECFEAGELARLWGRSRDWVVRTFYAAGAMPWGVIHRDGGGWLIPASVTEAYLVAHVPGEKVASEKGRVHGFGGEGKVLQRGELAGLADDRQGRSGRAGAGGSADCVDGVSVGAVGFAGVIGG